jgi:hypothetical protein
MNKQAAQGIYIADESYLMVTFPWADTPKNKNGCPIFSVRVQNLAKEPTPVSVSVIRDVIKGSAATKFMFTVNEEGKLKVKELNK